MHISNLRKKLGEHGDLILNGARRRLPLPVRRRESDREDVKMRSIFFKVLLWSLGTFALSLVAYWGIWRALDRGGPPQGDPFPHLMHMVEDDLRPRLRNGWSRAARGRASEA